MAGETELSEDDLFEGAVSNEPAVKPEAEASAVEQPEAPAEPEQVVEAAAEKPAVDDNAPQVPSWRVREINEEKRALAAELEQLRAERAQWQRQQQPKPEAKPAEKPAKPDPLLDPEGYADWVEKRAEERILNDRREDSLQAAREANPKEFDEAYAAAGQSRDPALWARMNASRNPGKVLMEWHRESKTRQEIGGDLNAYKQKLREEALKDPEFRKAAIAAWQADAQPQANGRPRVELPPSLNGASRSNAALRSSQTDVSDEALWEETTA